MGIRIRNMRSSRPATAVGALLLGAAFAFFGAVPAACGDTGQDAVLHEILESVLIDVETDPVVRASIRRDAERLLTVGTAPELLVDLVSRAQEQGVSGADIGKMFNRAGGLAEASLPVEPVLDRYLQGMAKGIDLPRIETVVTGIETHLVESAQLIERAWPRDEATPHETARLEMIGHGAYALGVGVPGKELAAALSLSAGEVESLSDARAPVLAVGCLVSGGIGPDRSLEVVRTAWRHGYRGPDLERLGQALGSVPREEESVSDEMITRVLGEIQRGRAHHEIFGYLEALHRHGMGHAPGMGSWDDPSDMHGPGGQPDDPAHQGGHDPHDDHQGHDHDHQGGGR